jgi:hypothetical protein
VLDTLEPASLRGEVAQSVEHTAENRGVAGSIPALATSIRAVFGVPPGAACESLRRRAEKGPVTGFVASFGPLFGGAHRPFIPYPLGVVSLESPTRAVLPWQPPLPRELRRCKLWSVVLVAELGGLRRVEPATHRESITEGNFS